MHALLYAERLPALGLQFNDYDMITRRHIVAEIEEIENELKEIEAKKFQSLTPRGPSFKVCQP